MPLVDDRPVGFGCSTLDGPTIDPTEAVANALIGHIRRVVMGAGSMVIDLAEGDASSLEPPNSPSS